jgi:hypothetical protein
VRDSRNGEAQNAAQCRIHRSIQYLNEVRIETCQTSPLRLLPTGSAAPVMPSSYTTQPEIEQMGRDLDPAIDWPSPNRDENFRPFRFCRLACREWRHYHGRERAPSNGWKRRGLGTKFIRKTEKSTSPRGMFQVKRLRRTWGSPSWRSPTSKIIRNQK